MMPWVAMSFWPLYLQLLGFSDNVSGMIVSLFTLGTAFGCQLAGFLGVRLDEVFCFLCQGGGEVKGSRGREVERSRGRGR